MIAHRFAFRSMALSLGVMISPATAGLVPGGGPTRSDCYVEVDVTTVESGTVEASKKIACTDGDTCDTGACGDDSCTFELAVCINQSDPALPDCTPPATLNALKASGKARGAGKLTVPVPAILEGSMCGAFVDVTTAIKVKKSGTKKPGKAGLKLVGKAPRGTKPRTDKDKVQLICLPRTDPCPTTTTSTTNVTSTTTGTTTTTSTTIPAPILEGLDPTKPISLPIDVQAAYNDDTMFFHISWEGDRGDTHDYVRFVGGVWRAEGGPRRDAQATIDNDPVRGPTNINSTIYESRVAFMINDPSGPNAVADFDRFGCFLTCHDDSRAMPTWDSSNDRTKYLNTGTTGALDLWHHRLARANPIGASDDQHVAVIPMGAEDTGGRLNDTGDSPWQMNNIVGDAPTYAFDPATTGGAFAFKFPDLFLSPMRFFRRVDAAELGAGPVPVGIDFATAVTQGYVPEENDTIPARRLRQPTGSRGDITAFGTTFTPSASDPLFGRHDSNTQRLLDTGNSDDTALVDGGVYDVAFAVHTGKVNVRDHYVSLALTLSLGGGSADIEAVKVAGTGRGTLPNFADTTQFPVERVNLVLPGITSLEFLVGDNAGLEYIDPETDTAVDQMHGGSTALVSGGLGCRHCHTPTAGDPFDPPGPGGFNAGPLSVLVPQRGGVHTPTPIPPPVP